MWHPALAQLAGAFLCSFLFRKDNSPELPTPSLAVSLYIQHRKLQSHTAVGSAHPYPRHPKQPPPYTADTPPSSHPYYFPPR